MRILVPSTGEIFEAELIEDAQGVPRVIEGPFVKYVLSTILKGGWRVIDATPVEWAQLTSARIGEHDDSVRRAG